MRISVIGRLCLTAVLVVVAVAGAGCGDKPQDAANSGSRPSGGARRTIAVIPKGTTHEFWKSIHAGALKAAAETGVDIIWKGPPKEDDRNAQIQVVEDFIVKKVSGIVLAPLDDKALATPVNEAMKAGVPVVVVDSDLTGAEYVSFAATDNYAGGGLGAERIGALLKGKGRLLVLRYAIGSASTEKREAGFLDGIKKFPGITIVSDNQYGGATQETALAASENLLQKFKTGIDAVFCPNETTTAGMLRALRSEGMAGKVTFVGFDASEFLVAGLKSREIQGLVVQNPVQMGYLGVKAIVDHLDGKPVQKRIDTGVAMATPENMTTPAISALLNPVLPDAVK